MILKATNESIILKTATAAAIDVHAMYADHTSTSFNPGALNSKITTATITTIVGVPPISTQRQIKHITITNVSTNESNIISVDINSPSIIRVYNANLSPGESACFDGQSWVKYTSTGAIVATTPLSQDMPGDERSLYKVGTATEAAGVFYCFAKDSGFPGAWTVGTPGLVGRATDGTSASDAGSLNFGTPESGSWYLRDMNISTTASGFVQLMDLLWVNTGIAVTTTTAQTINSVALPARDTNGTTNGKGVEAGILITTATTNAAAITNITLSYTNSNGVAGRTATMSSFPATAVVGTLVKFQLQAGDAGVRSIQSITLGTSLVSGAISLIMFETILSASCTLANAGNLAYPRSTDIKLYDGHVLIPIIQTGGAVAVTLSGNIYAINK